MTTLGQVKLNRQYDRYENTDPVAGTDDIGVGRTWLNYTTGDAFQQTLEHPSYFIQIDHDFDAKASQILAPTYQRIINECRDALLSPRDEILDETPDSIRRTTYWYLNEYHSIYAPWMLSGASIETVSATALDIVGTLDDLEPGDEVFIIGSKRNDGLREILTVDAAGLTFTEALAGAGIDRFAIALANVPTDLNQIIARMIYFDLEYRPHRTGIQTERIGTYSYTLGGNETMVAGLSYPIDIAAGIESYLGIGPIADAEEIP